MFRPVATITSFGVLLTLAFAGCSGGKSTPASPSATPVVTSTPPTATTATVLSIKVSGPSQVTMGQSGSFTALAQLSDGSDRDVTNTATWSSSDPTIATVSAGAVTGVFVGAVSITARVGDVAGSSTATVVGTFVPGVVFGPGVSAADQELVRTAHSVNERFWGSLLTTTVLAYQTVPEVVAAYEVMCRCTLGAQKRLELDHEAMASAPNVLLVALGVLRSLPDQMARLTHSEFHSIQTGFTGGRVDPTWLAEGSAEYSQVHAMANAGLVNADEYHQWIRQRSSAYPAGLREWEAWPANPLGPGGCQQTNSCSAPYLLGHFASDLLTVRLSRSSLISFWRETGTNLRRGMNPDLAWRTAFSATFEISVDQFYVAFEDYRRRGFR